MSAVKSNLVKCAQCGKIVTKRIPRGGDGSLWLPWWHKGPDGKPCEGRRQEAEAAE